jgi:outer membrane immunogenic protein
MRRIAFLAVGLSIGQAAMAADLRPLPQVKAPVVPAFNWTGCYLGGNVGYQYGEDKITTTTAPANFAAGGAAFLDGITPATLRPAGAIGGVQGGCNYEISSVVIGFEADADWTGGVAQRTFVVPAGAPVAQNDFMTDSARLSFLSTVRGRIGVAFDRVLLFATGGVAFGTVKTVDTLGTAGGAAVSTTNTTANRTGWTAGAGAEFAVTDNWLLKVEYLYVDLGTFDAGIACLVACVAANDTVVHHKYTDNMVRVGINYKFGGPIYARY